jgi:putative lipase involved disintegration of autophagic bodies
MYFHKKYKKITPWWRFVTAEFKLLYDHTRMTNIFGYSFEDDFVKLEKSGLLTVKDCFDWGASGPTIDTESSREASLIHDAIYHLSNIGIFKGKKSDKMKELADELLYKICIENGMYKWRAKAWLKALDMFGDAAWEKGI